MVQEPSQQQRLLRFLLRNSSVCAESHGIHSALVCVQTVADRKEASRASHSERMGQVGHVETEQERGAQKF